VLGFPAGQLQGDSGAVSAACLLNTMLFEKGHQASTCIVCSDAVSQPAIAPRDSSHNG